METKHSKGDWQARRDECHYDSLTDIYAGDVKIAEVVASPNGSTVEELEANTRLMATAPELLQALVELYGSIDMRTIPTGIVFRVTHAVLKAIGK